MTDPDLAQAWADVHENTPDGWFVGRPGWEDRYREWSQFAFDPSEPAPAHTPVHTPHKPCVGGYG